MLNVLTEVTDKTAKMSGEGQLSPRLEPISWIIGTWESVEGKGQFPTIADFEYKEVVEFRPVGLQPLLKYTGSSSHPVKGNPMHNESGYLRVRGETDFSFMVAHNFGLTTLEEGAVDGQKILLKTSEENLVRMGADPAKAKQGVRVTQLQRKFTIDPESRQLTQEVWMATDKTTDLTLHLRAVYNRKN